MAVSTNLLPNGALSCELLVPGVFHSISGLLPFLCASRDALALAMSCCNGPQQAFSVSREIKNPFVIVRVDRGPSSLVVRPYRIVTQLGQHKSHSVALHICAKQPSPLRYRSVAIQQAAIFNQLDGGYEKPVSNVFCEYTFRVTSRIL